MDAAAPADASSRAFGLAVAAFALVGGWLLAMPFADGLGLDGGVLALSSFALLGGGSLALVGFGGRIAPAAWAGAGVASVLFFFARLVWPFLPAPILLVACAAWWHARQPRAAWGAWQPAQPFPPLAPAPPFPQAPHAPQRKP